MERTIVFIRHGESTSNKIIHDATDSTTSDEIDRAIERIKNPQLTDLGHAQAKCVAKYLSGIFKQQKIKDFRVCSSPYTRAIQTANPLAKEFNKPIHIIEGSQEYTKPNHEIDGFPIDESFDCFKERVHKSINSLKDLLMDNPTSPLIFYGHSLFISYMLSSLNRTYSDMSYFSNNEMGFKIPNASITTLIYNPDTDKFIVSNMSNVFHLGEHATGTTTEVGTMR